MPPFPHGPAPADRALSALRASVVRLHELCRGLDDVQLESPSYCTEWSIADVLSHLGSGAVIFHRALDDALAGRSTPEEFPPAVWAAWTAKSPRTKADDALVEDEALLERFEGIDGATRAGLACAMGPLTLSFAEAVAMRLNEHVLHTWDVEVTFDEAAHIPEDAAAVVVDNLALIVRFTARPTGIERRLEVRTSHPARRFSLLVTAAGAELAPSSHGGEPDLALPAESLCRLVYGRLDADHSPPLETDAGLLEALRQTFPGP